MGANLAGNLVLSVDGKSIRGDLVKSLVYRSGAFPIPVTLEAVIRVDAALAKKLVKGEIVAAGRDEFRIIKSEPATTPGMQGQHVMSAIKITALIDAFHQLAFVADKAVYKKDARLSEILRACGASVKSVEGDVTVPLFFAPFAQVRTGYIAKVLQEEGLFMRYKAGKLRFFRLQDLMNQKPGAAISVRSGENVKSGFLERNEVPQFMSLDKDGAPVFSGAEKTRVGRFVHGKSAQQLNNMSCYLVKKKTVNIDISDGFAAGDLVMIDNGAPLAIAVAAHVFHSGTDGSGANQYSRLWLGRVEGG